MGGPKAPEPLLTYTVGCVRILIRRDDVRVAISVQISDGEGVHARVAAINLRWTEMACSVVECNGYCITGFGAIASPRSARDAAYDDIRISVAIEVRNRQPETDIPYSVDLDS